MAVTLQVCANAPPYVASLGTVRMRGRSIIAKPQNHPAVPGKDDALTIMLDEAKLLEFT